MTRAAFYEAMHEAGLLRSDAPSAKSKADRRLIRRVRIAARSRPSPFKGESVRELADKLIEYQRNGGRVVYEAGPAKGAE